MTTTDKAAEFMLTQIDFDRGQSEDTERAAQSSHCLHPLPSKSVLGRTTSGKACFYCKKPGHLIAEGPVLSKKQKTPKFVALIKAMKPRCSVATSKERVSRLFIVFHGILFPPALTLTLDAQDFLPFNDETALGRRAQT